MAIKHFVLGALLFTALNALSQQNINRGKIYTSTGTLEGYISTSVLGETPQEFKISNKENGPFDLINSDQISRVEFDNGVKFEKHSFDLYLLNKEYFDRSKENYNNTKQKLHAFVQKVLEGNISLYIFKDQYSYPHFYYQSLPDTNLVLLVNNPYVDEKNAIQNDYAYINQLSFLVQQNGCEKKVSISQNTNYEVLSILKVIEKINECTGSTITYNYRKRKEPLHLTAEITGGINRVPVKISTDDNSDTKYLIAPIGGFTLKLSKKGNEQSLNFLLDVLTSDYNTNDSTHNGFYSSATNLKNFTVTVVPGVRIYLSDKSVKPLVEIGMSVISLNFDKSTEKQYQGSTLFTTKTEKGSHTNVGGAAFLGVGAGSRRVSASVRFVADFSRLYSGFYFAGALVRIALWK